MTFTPLTFSTFDDCLCRYYCFRSIWHDENYISLSRRVSKLLNCWYFPSSINVCSVYIVMWCRTLETSVKKYRRLSGLIDALKSVALRQFAKQWSWTKSLCTILITDQLIHSYKISGCISWLVLVSIPHMWFSNACDRNIQRKPMQNIPEFIDKLYLLK